MIPPPQLFIFPPSLMDYVTKDGRLFLAPLAGRPDQAQAEVSVFHAENDPSVTFLAFHPQPPSSFVDSDRYR